jgi:hypothetical protein
VDDKALREDTKPQSPPGRQGSIFLLDQLKSLIAGRDKTGDLRARISVERRGQVAYNRSARLNP